MEEVSIVQYETLAEGGIERTSVLVMQIIS